MSTAYAHNKAPHFTYCDQTPSVLRLLSDAAPWCVHCVGEQACGLYPAAQDLLEWCCSAQPVTTFKVHSCVHLCVAPLPQIGEECIYAAQGPWPCSAFHSLLIGSSAHHESL